MKEKAEIDCDGKEGLDGQSRMSVPSLFDLTLWQLANDPDLTVCSAYEQFLEFSDDGLRNNGAHTFLNKFLELLVQRRVVWRGDHYIRRFALAIPTALRHVRTLARRGEGGGWMRRANARIPSEFFV